MMELKPADKRNNIYDLLTDRNVISGDRGQFIEGLKNPDAAGNVYDLMVSRGVIKDTDGGRIDFIGQLTAPDDFVSRSSANQPINDELQRNITETREDLLTDSAPQTDTDINFPITVDFNREINSIPSNRFNDPEGAARAKVRGRQRELNRRTDENAERLYGDIDKEVEKRKKKLEESFRKVVGGDRLEAGITPFVSSLERSKAYVDAWGREQKENIKSAGDLFKKASRGTITAEDITNGMLINPDDTKKFIDFIAPEYSSLDVSQPNVVTNLVAAANARIKDNHVTNQRLIAKENQERAKDFANSMDISVDGDRLGDEEYLTLIQRIIKQKEQDELSQIKPTANVMAAGASAGGALGVAMPIMTTDFTAEESRQRDEIQNKYQGYLNTLALLRGDAASSDIMSNGSLTFNQKKYAIGLEMLKVADRNQYELVQRGLKDKTQPYLGTGTANDNAVIDMGSQIAVKNADPDNFSEVYDAQANIADEFPEYKESEIYAKLSAFHFNEESSRGWFRLNTAEQRKTLVNDAYLDGAITRDERDYFFNVMEPKEAARFTWVRPASYLLGVDSGIGGSSVSKILEETGSPVESFFNFFFKPRDDQKNAQELLQQPFSTSGVNPGEVQYFLQEKEYLESRLRNGDDLSDADMERLSELQRFSGNFKSGVRGVAENMIGMLGQLGAWGALTRGVGFLFKTIGGVAGRIGAVNRAQAFVKFRQIESDAIRLGLKPETRNTWNKFSDFMMRKDGTAQMAVFYAGSYDDYAKNSLALFPDDESGTKREIYAAVGGLANAIMSNMFMTTKVVDGLKFNKFINPNIASLVDQLSEANLSKAVFGRELQKGLTKVFNDAFKAQGLKDWVVNVAGENLKISGEMASINLATDISQIVLSPQSMGVGDVFKNTAGVFGETFLNSTLASAAAARGKVAQKRGQLSSIPGIVNGNIFHIAGDVEYRKSVINEINRQEQQGDLSKEEAQAKRLMVNTIELQGKDPDIVSVIDRGAFDVETGALNKDAATVERGQEGIRRGIKLLSVGTQESLTKKKIESDPNNEGLKKQLEQIQKLKQQLLNGDVEVADDYSVVGKDDAVEKLNRQEKKNELDKLVKEKKKADEIDWLGDLGDIEIKTDAETNVQETTEPEPVQPVETPVSQENSLVDRVKANDAVKTLVSGDDISMAKDQSLTAPASLENQSKDKDLVTDLIASNERADIEKALENNNNLIREGNEDFGDLETLDRNNVLLEEGLKKHDENVSEGTGEDVEARQKDVMSENEAPADQEDGGDNDSGRFVKIDDRVYTDGDETVYIVPTSNSEVSPYIEVDKKTYDKWKKLDDEEKTAKKRIENSYLGRRNQERRNSALRGNAMRYAAEKREILGTVTNKEKSKTQESQNKLQLGDGATVNGTEYTVIGFPFGRIKLSTKGRVSNGEMTISRNSELADKMLSEKRRRLSERETVDPIFVNDIESYLKDRRQRKKNQSEIKDLNESKGDDTGKPETDEGVRETTDNIIPESETKPQGQESEKAVPGDTERAGQGEPEVTAPILEPKEGDKVTLPALRKGFSGRRMVFKDGEWQNEVGGKVSKSQQDEANKQFIEENNAPKLSKGKGTFKSIAQETFDTLVNRLNKAFGGAAKVTGLDEFNARAKELGVNPVDLTDRNGTVFGAILPDGSIYLNREKINANTPIHEHTHLFNQVIQKTNPKLWSKIVEATKGTELWNEVKNDPNYSNLKTDSQIADEVFSRITGDRGEGSWQQRVNEADSKTPLGKLKDLIKEYWDKVKEFFGADIYKDMSADDFADMALNKLFSGKEIKGARENIEQSRRNAERNKGLSEMQMSVLGESDFDKDGNVKPEVAAAIKKEYADIEAKAKADGTWKEAPNGKPSKLNDQQWVAVRSKRFKDWFGDWESEAENKVIQSRIEGLLKTGSDSLQAPSVRTSETTSHGEGTKNNNVSKAVDANGEPLVKDGVFRNTITGQEKSATGNAGTFSSERNDTRFSKELEGASKISNFDNQNLTNDRRTEENNQLREALGDGAERDELYKTLQASNEGAGERTADGEGQTAWDKERFLGLLQVNSIQDGTWTDDVKPLIKSSLSKGNENEVYIAKDGVNVIKVNNLKNNDTFDSFVNRVNAQNEVFPNSHLKITGITENSVGEISVILEQPYINTNQHATQSEIDNHLLETGWQRTKLPNGRNGWVNGEYTMWDAEPKNVLKDRKNNLYFIDTVINKIENKNTRFQSSESTSDNVKLSNGAEVSRESFNNVVNNVARALNTSIDAKGNVVLDDSGKPVFPTVDVLKKDLRKLRPDGSLDELAEKIFEEASKQVQLANRGLTEANVKKLNDLLKPFDISVSDESSVSKDAILKQLGDKKADKKVVDEVASILEDMDNGRLQPNELTKQLTGALQNTFNKMYNAAPGEHNVLEIAKNDKELRRFFEGRDDVRFMRNKQGVFGAYIPNFDGTGRPKIILNGEKLNPNTVFHEAVGHMVMDWMEASDQYKPFWERGMRLVGRGTEYYERIANSDFYQNQIKALGLTGEAAERYIQKEALATAIGDKGGKFLTTRKKNTFRQWWNGFIDGVREFFGLKNMSRDQIEKMDLEEFAKRAVSSVFDRKAFIVETQKAMDDVPQKNPPKEYKGKTKSGVDYNAMSMRHKDTDGLRKFWGMDEREKTTTTDEQEFEEGRSKYEAGELPDFIDRWEAWMKNPKSQDNPNGAEQPNVPLGTRAMIRMGIFALDTEMRRNPSAKIHKELDRLTTVSASIGSVAGADLRKSRIDAVPKDSLTEFLNDIKDTMGLDLTDEEAKRFTKTYNEITERREKFDNIEKGIKEEQEKKDNTAHVKTKIAGHGKKTTSENKKSITAAKSKLEELKQRVKALNAKRDAKLGGMFMADEASDKLTLNEETAPFVREVFRAYSDMIDESNLDKKLDTVLENTLGEVGDLFEDINKDDISAIMAGKYSETKTVQEARKEYNDLLKLNQLNRDIENAKAGIVPERNGRKRESNIKKRAEIKRKEQEYEDIIKINGWYNLKRTDKAIEDIKRRMADIQDQIDRGDFREPVKSEPLRLSELSEGKQKEYREAKAALMDKLIEHRKELAKIAYAANKTRGTDITRTLLNLASLPRALMASMDMSFLLRQGQPALFSHFGTSKDAFLNSFGDFKNERNVEEFFFDLRRNRWYDTMIDTKLGLTGDPAAKMSPDRREEVFMSSWADRIPGVLHSERMYVGYLNRLRVDLFTQMAEQLEGNGISPETNKEAYKAIAGYVNALTGRGNLPKVLQKFAPFLNSTLFAPRFAASRIRMLTYFANPEFWGGKGIGKEAGAMIRYNWAKDIGSFMIGNIARLYLTQKIFNLFKDDDDYPDVTISWDARGSDFGKLRIGDLRLDPFAGFGQYAVFAGRMVAGETRTGRGEIKDLYSGRGGAVMQFARYKFSPVAGITTDLLLQEDAIGNLLPGNKNYGSSTRTKNYGEWIADYLRPMAWGGAWEAITQQKPEKDGNIFENTRDNLTKDWDKVKWVYPIFNLLAEVAGDGSNMYPEFVPKNKKNKSNLRPGRVERPRLARPQRPVVEQNNRR